MRILSLDYQRRIGAAQSLFRRRVCLRIRVAVHPSAASAVMMTMVTAVVMPAMMLRHVLHGCEGRARADEKRQDECDYGSEFLHGFFPVSPSVGLVGVMFQPARGRRLFRARRRRRRRDPAHTRTLNRNARASEHGAESSRFSRLFARAVPSQVARGCGVCARHFKTATREKAKVKGKSKKARAEVRKRGQTRKSSESKLSMKSSSPERVSTASLFTFVCRLLFRRRRLRCVGGLRG